MTFEELRKKWQKLDLRKIEAEILKELEAEIIKLNQGQLEIGQDSDGLMLPEYASIYYTNYKQRKGSKSGTHFDLKDEENFYKGMFLDQRGYDSFVDSKDEKRNRIVNELTGDHIFGLQQNNLQNLIDNQIEQMMISKIEKQIN